ncbi:hypothetical protein ABXT64_04400 [Candidatus Marifrigoribacter sp. Uisw_064]|jgi:nitrite reductase/ring-hydroxylating ferredoxin subunit|uniref:Rieske (2Fe-2S) protein n=1 Tax=Candidatus Marifrigoribacter sp. Uisw_064 TaxID=3230970 RepID=UPI003D3B352D
MKKIISILLIAVLFASCSFDDNQNSNDDNQNDNNILELSPPNWILDTWLKSGVSNEGFRFEQNDIYILDGANDEISFLDTRIEVLSEGHGYILKDELETSSEYWVNTEIIDEDTGQTLEGTIPKTWKWERVCSTGINQINAGEILRNENPNLIIPLLDMNINLNLPEYNALKFPGNSVEIYNQGIKGIVVYNVNNSFYTAYELSDPNHLPSSCSRMTIEGIIATCQCDGNRYDIVTGQTQDDQCKYSMIQYQVERTGDNIHIWN